MNFIEKSIEIILNHQDQGGAYIASPFYPPYQYGWFRDGVYTAYAMDLYGYHQSAEMFFDWSVDIIDQYSQKIKRIIQNPGLAVGGKQEAIFHCRFTPEGDEIISGWSTHQLDGLGLWVWGIVQHSKTMGWASLPKKWRPLVNLVIEYLMVLWSYPCADCWEENDDQIHTYTLAAVIGGVEAFQDFTQTNHLECEVELIKEYIAQHCISPQGYYRKSVNNPDVDANLLGLVFPFNITNAKAPIFLKTLSVIEEVLRVPRGGLRRYPEDSYYGGGEWILLTAWLGLIFTALGENEKAFEIKTWIENQADKNGMFSEQVIMNVQNRTSLQDWIRKWGQPAKPLLWSHANYLILCNKLDEAR